MGNSLSKASIQQCIDIIAGIVLNLKTFAHFSFLIS